MNENDGYINKKVTSDKINSEVFILLEKKIDFFKDIIQKTIIYIQTNKTLDILGINDVFNCIEKLGSINETLNSLSDIKDDSESLIKNLQIINNELSLLFKNYGTYSLDDLLLVCFGNNKKVSFESLNIDKIWLLKKFFHPINYRVVTKKEELKQLSSTLTDIVNTPNFGCYDVFSTYKQFHVKVYGMKLYIYSNILNKGLIIFGYLDDVVIDYLNNEYITEKKKIFYEKISQQELYDKDIFEKFMSSLLLKDYLIYENENANENANENEIYNKYAGYISKTNNLIQKPISQTMKEFISEDIFYKRNMLISLLVCSSNYENQYLAYLLYDILSNETNDMVDTQEQTIIFDSLPWSIKHFFKNAMKKNIQYTNDLLNFDINKIPLSQQVCLMKVPDSVKEKAMIKLKEVNAKTEDSGFKAKQYLECLLKIPFNIYRREPILYVMDTIKTQFKDICKIYKNEKWFSEIPIKAKYTGIEIFKYMKIIQDNTTNNKFITLEKMKSFLLEGDKKKLTANFEWIHKKIQNMNMNKKGVKTVTKSQLKTNISDLIDLYKLPENSEFLEDIVNSFIMFTNTEKNTIIETKNTVVTNKIELLNGNILKISDYMEDVKNTLSLAIYGHDKAKKQIERIIGQWINGEQTGYCFGFEGPPGVGKTSLGKHGISNCLKDENGVKRPFAMIQMGGDSNGSTLHGHNYTYVASTWGSIVQILVDKKCMNPIIFIDEVDKISRTDHGREIIGILTHLLDPTQNDFFQDKYFNGIDLDLSKALFILSYNDVDAIDKILLDRIHRIKFSNLSLEDKVVICKTHILPEILQKMGLEEMILFEDNILKFIVEEYTSEPGVRKLKECLFEIVGEINLEILIKNENINELPIKITIEDIKHKYFKDKREIKTQMIHNESKVGVINALWANSYGHGGVLPLQASFIPSNKFLELTLTGSMGDVMKESISVSLTNAWNLTSLERQQFLIEKYNDPKKNSVFGLHIHCPDISTKKDGPSATTAFTVLIYSLINNIKIKNYFGITGETNFSFQLTEIGGLQEKIIQSIKAGIKEFIYPQVNQFDFDRIMDKYRENEIIKGILFHPIENIHDVFDLILEK